MRAFLKNAWSAEFALAIAHRFGCEWAQGVTFPKSPRRILLSNIPEKMRNFFRGMTLKFGIYVDGRKRIETVPLPE